MQIQLIEITTYPGDYTNYRFMVGENKFSANVYTRFNGEVSLFEMRRIKRTGKLKPFEVKTPQKKEAILDALFAATCKEVSISFIREALEMMDRVVEPDKQLIDKMMKMTK